MTNATEFAQASSFLITAAIGFVFFYWVWQQYVIDSTRQELFELRDKIFDLASSGALDRKSEQYEMLRSLFNKSIRYADELDAMRLIIFLVTARATEVHNIGLPVKHLIESIMKIENQYARDQILSILEKKSKILTWHIYRRSLLLMVLIPVIAFFLSFVLVSVDWIGRAARKIGHLASETVTYADA